MHLLTLLIAALAPATLIDGLPIHGNHEQSNASTLNGTIVSHVRVRRDIPLTARDIEEADQNGVDLNKMYKHSILKHSDGSDYSIWVHNSFDSDVKDDEKSANDTSALGKRSWGGIDASTNDRMPNGFKFDDHSDTCGKSDWKKRTSKFSPFADGADAIVEWTFKNNGGWRLAPEEAFYSTDILIGGSNTGANMRFSVRKNAGRVVILGTKDVRDITTEASHRFKRMIRGVWRMAGKGKMGCWDGNEQKTRLWWEIDRSDRDIKAESPPVKPEPTHQVEQHRESEYQPEPSTKTVYYPVPVAPKPEPSTRTEIDPYPETAPAPLPKSDEYYHQVSYQPGPATELSDSIPPGGYRPGEGPPGFPGQSDILSG
ncbi:hypothetical protein H9Q69_011551 [Fusarium xylarioides]|nr:hypothetical protein H9Q69_011551 [Fusarium xylarioides]